jgi:acetamidase/formamidase
MLNKFSLGCVLSLCISIAHADTAAAPQATTDPAATTPAAAAPQTAPVENSLPYLSGLLDQNEMIAPKSTNVPDPKTYILPATPSTSQWGVYDSKLTPVLNINSGDTVVIETMAASDNQVVPGATIEQIVKIQNAIPGRGPHTLTGPIYVNGAEAGDVLRIHINKIVPRAYASNNTATGKGLFPDIFPNPRVRYYYLDVKNKKMQFLPGIVVPLAPFPGIVAVARNIPGKYDSIPPGPFGGNMDLRELTEGSTLYLPVFTKGAYLWTGDSHAGQGNGEINLTAIETAFQEFNITVDVIKQKSLTWPRVETPTAWIAVGYDKDLNKALDILKEETVKLISEQRNVTPEDAKKIMYETWNCPIAEVVNGISGVYCMVPKQPTVKAEPLPTRDTDTMYVTTSIDPDLMKAMKGASMTMLQEISTGGKISMEDAYVLASFAMDCRIAPHQTGDKKVVCMMAKSLWTDRI